MKEANLYRSVDFNSDIMVCESKGDGNEYNFGMIEGIFFNKCSVCGKILAPWEIYNHKYCKYCLEVIKSGKSTSYSRCIECNKSLPTSQLYKFKYCPDCAEMVRVCECCNNEFILKDEDSFICPSCIDTLSTECIKCGKGFIPEGTHSYFCPSCYSEYKRRMEIQIMEDTMYGIEIYKSSNNGNSDNFNSLINNLNGDNPVKRAVALETLCSIENKRALSILIGALKNKDTNIRWKAARYLGSSMSKDAVEPLIEALEDDEFIVRNNVVWSLGEIGDKRATRPLTLALNDKNKYVRFSAEEALEKIKDNRK